MTWTAPMTAVAGSVFTAAQFNTFIRDNLSETAPAKATTPGSIFAVSDTNEISERIPKASTDNDSVTVTATSFDDPDTGTPGPVTTAITGVSALVGWHCNQSVASATARVETSYEVSGATSIGASSNISTGYSVSNSASGLILRSYGVNLATLLTPGANTFMLKYNVSSGSGTVDRRRIWVVPF